MMADDAERWRSWNNNSGGIVPVVNGDCLYVRIALAPVCAAATTVQKYGDPDDGGEEEG